MKNDKIKKNQIRHFQWFSNNVNIEQNWICNGSGFSYQSYSNFSFFCKNPESKKFAYLDLFNVLHWKSNFIITRSRTSSSWRSSSSCRSTRWSTLSLVTSSIGSRGADSQTIHVLCQSRNSGLITVPTFPGCRTTRCRRNWKDSRKYRKKLHNTTQCLKSIEKVAFNIASEASYVYILSGIEFFKNAKNG